MKRTTRSFSGCMLEPRPAFRLSRQQAIGPPIPRSTTEVPPGKLVVVRLAARHRSAASRNVWQADHRRCPGAMAPRAAGYVSRGGARLQGLYKQNCIKMRIADHPQGTYGVGTT